LHDTVHAGVTFLCTDSWMDRWTKGQKEKDKWTDGQFTGLFESAQVLVAKTGSSTKVRRSPIITQINWLAIAAMCGPVIIYSTSIENI